MTGLTLPVALAAGQSTTFNVTFTPSIKRRGQWKSGHRQQRFQLQPEHSADGQCRHPWRTQHQRFQSQFWQRSG